MTLTPPALRFARHAMLTVLGASVVLVGCEMSAAGPDRATRHEAAADDSAEATEFEGRVASVDTDGSTLTLEDDRVIAVDDSTEWEADDGDEDGDHYLTSLSEVQTALDSGWTVEAEAEGREQSDGSLLARELEAEVEDDDDDADEEDEAEFEGIVASVDTDGSTLTLEDDRVIAVDDSTMWKSGDGDEDDEHYLTSLSEVQTALDSGWTVEAEAEGREQSDGSLLARELEAEVEDDDDDADEEDEAEFEGIVASVDTDGSTLTLEDDRVIAVDDSTMWKSGDGDEDDEHYLTSLSEVQTALDSGWTVEAEAEGREQSDGSLLARELEAEVEDDDDDADEEDD